MTPRPLISVIVPAHNAERDLDACISAILSSDIDRELFELIIVDDGSTDSTRKIAEARADRVLETGASPFGPAYARNLGAQAAEGELIAFIDADVTIHPDALGRMTSVLRGDKQIVAVFGSYDDTPLHADAVSRYRNLLHHYAHNQSPGRVATFWAGCGMVRADAFAEAGGFDHARYPRPQIEDIELGYRLNRLGGIVLDPSIQCTHRKKWTVRSIVRTDFRDRAVPWVQLLLSRNGASSGGTPSLGLGALVSAGAAAVGLLLLIAGLIVSSKVALFAAAAALVVAAGVGWRFYTFLFARGGFPLVLAGIPLHLIYQLESAAAVPVGAIRYAKDRIRGGSGTSTPLHGLRFLPLAFGEAGGRAIAFIATAYLARVLGADAFGMIGFALAFVAYFGIALGVGIGEISARDVARSPADAPAIIVDTITLRLILAFVAIAAILGISSLLEIDSATRAVTWLYAFTVVPLAFETTWAYKGIGRTRPVGYSLLLSQAVALVGVLILVRSPADVMKVPLVQIVGDLSAAAFLIIPIMSGAWRRPSRSAVTSIARRSGMITLSRVLRTIIVSFDVVILGVLATSRDVGLYSAAYRLIFFVTAVIYAAHTAFVPDVAKLDIEPHRLSGVLSKSIALAMTVTVPFVVGGSLVAASLIELIFGSEYREAATAFQFLLASLLLFAIHGATRSIFIALQKIGVETIIVAVGAIVNIALNFVLIPQYGIVGAALATAGGEAAILIGAFAVLLRANVRPVFTGVMPAMLAGIVMALALWLGGVTRPAWQTVPAGAIVYILTLASANLAMRRASPAMVSEMR